MTIVERQITINNKQGLHARPAAIFVQVANKYESEISVRKDNEEINGKSIMGILMLAAEGGSVVTVIAKGYDAHEAVDALEHILINQLGNIQTPKTKATKRRKKL